jgi:hypothetical protein
LSLKPAFKILTALNTFYYSHNDLILLEGIEISIKLIKNNRNMPYNILKNMTDNILKHLNYDFTNYDFSNCNEYIELTNLFSALFVSENEDKIDQYIERIEQMIIELRGFENYILK